MSFSLPAGGAYVTFCGSGAAPRTAIFPGSHTPTIWSMPHPAAVARLCEPRRRRSQTGATVDLPKLEPLSHAVKRLAVDAENPGGPGFIFPRHLQDVREVALFKLIERGQVGIEALKALPGARHGPDFFRQVTKRNHPRAVERHRRLERILELPDVSRPVISDQSGERPRLDRYVSAPLNSEFPERVFHEQRNIFGAIPQRGQSDFNHPQAVIEVLAESAFG